MKFVKYSALALLVATPSFAGGMSEPMMEPVVIEEQATSSSRAGVLVPVLALVLLALAASNN